MPIDPVRFNELCRKAEKARIAQKEAECMRLAADETLKAAVRAASEANNDLQEYVQQCAGDPALGSYRR